MLPKDVPIKTLIYRQSPFKKVISNPNPIPKINSLNEQRQIFHPNTSQDKYNINPPIRFGLNFYFGQPKQNFYQPIIHYTPNIQPQEICYPYYNQEKMQTNILFKNSLAKSGYRLNPEQNVKFNDIYNKPNFINNNINNNNNNYYGNINYCPISNSNNIINNIYPTFTRVTNVQILPENNDPSKLSENTKENKKENISIINNNIKKEIHITKIDKTDTINITANNINSSNKKKLFECSETNGIDIKPKNLLKKKRVRKNGEQLELLSKFYNENKNWTKEQIKKISETIGLKENKIYKWLSDQKNKEYKSTKFVVNK